MSSTGAPPNYYAILEVSETATVSQIRDAYKRAALKTHPDRVPAESPERASRTRKFQLVNDAYYTLSDNGRRREYDAQRRMFGGGGSSSTAPGAFPDAFAEEDAETPSATAGAGAGQNAYSWAWNFFTGRGAEGRDRQEAENEQFGDVFEEMLREEGMADPGTGRPTSKFWGVIGGMSGGALGFIVANVPGLLAGAVAGNRLGAIRDAKGKSVYSVFQELPQDDRARLLSQLAAKVFSNVVGI
ncbi:DnaJ chaperone [Phialemonium atrogriseum]|uniref:DnaJ chaperone n=1 Tax=Phialemonium atrogriseum TaxID=1093897 RepID=A0AAJ0C6G9_9PEZI|nr:DnaJ chaperone [Phialemonium atrogriseum]KAK1769848.1 DnaJ chaperone [Phialemonium atrogriseum]